MSVHVFETMGTVVSLRADDLSAAADVEAVFREYDRTYSLYDDASPLSRVARGELLLAETSTAVRETYAEALAWRERTGGLFTPHRPDGAVDLSGIVKSLAIRDAGAILDDSCPSWLLSVGGDALSRSGDSTPEWRTGVVDPDDTSHLLGVVPVGRSRRAIATSGSAERGDHIWSRFGRAHFVQATVVADDIVTADVLATAVIAGREEDLDRITSTWDVDVLTVDRDGALRATPGARSWLSDTPVPSI
ncbi:FAD:protein FMN transferase [Frondihabitans cladoniiphilus]|uniref:FAD:protein FMN transferase n=1 Tax=Frondihabitans cladoniiphilus TaxID=715785 RepID=A0ABP8VHA2_9MICO